MILFAIRGCEGMFFRTLFRQNRIGMKLADALITRVGDEPGVRSQADARFFEKPEIMPPAHGKIQTDDSPIRTVHNGLCFQRVPFLFPGIVAALFF